MPILVRGGGKAPDAEIMERTVELMKQGAKGIVYGRNVIQHEKPTVMTQALMSIWTAFSRCGQRFAMSWLMGARRCDSRFIAPRLKKRIRAI